MTVVDLFAGPGGWDVAARTLGIEPLGVELDEKACETRDAAGLRTQRGDVAALDPCRFVDAVGLIASPPCQAFSRAGQRAGQQDVTTLRESLLRSCRSWVAPGPQAWADERSALMLEPLRWVHVIGPEWIALEQVPPVLRLWQTYSVALDALGYHVWLGTVDAADYGVPQHRERAVLLASRTRWPKEPRRTHGPGREPYVTMASALGWHDEGLQQLLQRRNDQSMSGEVDPLWPLSRPATTIAGRLLVADPGTNANRFNGKSKSRNDGYHVTDSEAGVLQGFPERYPWRGTQGERAEQIGNAVPPPLGAALLREVAA